MSAFTPEHRTFDGPEPVPPVELLEFRAALNQPPSDDVRSRHLAAVAEAVQASAPSAAEVGQAIARRGARVMVGVAAMLAVTTGLAGAQMLPAPARAILPAVSEHLLPGRQVDEPREVDTAPEPESTEKSTSTKAPRRGDPDRDGAVVAPATVESTTTSTSSSTTSSSTTTEPETTTTVPAPVVTVPPSSTSSTTTTTEPTSSTSSSSTTTTTTPTSSTTSTTAPGSAGSSTEEPDVGNGGAR